jgi:hypothetical protein
VYLIVNKAERRDISPMAKESSKRNRKIIIIQGKG